MHIEAELDEVHAERLQLLQERLQKPLPEALALAIDTALAQTETAGLHAYRVLDEAGLIGCFESDSGLSVDYKKHLWGKRR